MVFKVSFNYLDIYTIPNNNTKDFKMRRKKKKSKIVKLVMLKILTPPPVKSLCKSTKHHIFPYYQVGLNNVFPLSLTIGIN